MTHSIGNAIGALAKSRHTIAVTLGTLIPGGAVLISAGILHWREFVHQLLLGSSDEVSSLALAAGAGAMGALAIKHRSTSEKQERILADLHKGQREIRSAQQINGDELRQLLKEHIKNEKLLDRLLFENEEQAREIEVLRSRSYEVEDAPEFWQVAPGSYMLSFNGMCNAEAEENLTADGVTFRASKWAIQTWLPRIATDTHVNDWRIVLPIPKVLPAFDSLALFPARKLLAVLDDLSGNVAHRLEVPVTLKHIRISIVRDVHPSHCFWSIHSFIRQTAGGTVPTVVTYQRPHSRRAFDASNGRVTLHPGSPEQNYWRDVADQYFYRGIQMSVEEFRQALVNGQFPDTTDTVSADMVAFGDHFRFA